MALLVEHQLGTLARLGHTLFARQTLRGGWYELIDQNTSAPHPDFYIALMWKRLMVAGDVLDAAAKPAPHQSADASACAAQLRAFASRSQGDGR